MAHIVRTALVCVWAAATMAALGGCQTLPLTGRTESPHFGPVGPAIGGGSPASHDKVRLDVVIPVFDPGLPEDEDDYEKKGIWPELRRAEANRFAVLLKEELDATGMFGDVHVSPDASATGDLYVLGVIREANGEDVEIEVVTRDIGGSDWLQEEYAHRVKERFFKDPRNEGKDPYRPVFREVAKAIADEAQARPNEDLTSLRNLTAVRFAGVLAPDSFGGHVAVEQEEGRGWIKSRRNRTKFSLKSLPAQDDPAFRNTQAIRVQDGIFMAQLGEKYQTFYDDTQESYLIYQEAALPAAKQRREQLSKAGTKAVLGGITALGSVLLGRNAKANETVRQGLAVVGVVGGVALLEDALGDFKEAKRHEAALNELGSDIDLNLSPTVIEMEGQTVTMTGDAREQLREWQGHLKKMYDLQKVPERKL